MSVAAPYRLPKEFEPGDAGSSAPWMAERRVEALRRFQAAGIPHRRVEEWKYSDLRNVLEASSGEVYGERTSQARDPFGAISSRRFVINDGRFETTLSPADAPGIELFDLTTPVEDAPDWVKANLGRILSTGAMGHASLALMRGGLALHFTRDAGIPVHLRFLQNSDTVHCRLLIVVDPGAATVLMESHGQERGFTNLGTEIVLGANAALTHLRLAQAAPESIQVEEIGIRVARDGCYRAHFSQGGAKLSRVELAIALEGEGAKADMSGTSVLGGKLHADVTTYIDHIAGHTTSRQLFKYIAGGSARTVYQGKITVRKGADGSDSRQTAKALVMGAHAEADLKPELEILADDVKCAHGAAVGDLDADSLFYLRSRGLPERDAREMLIRGFLEEAIAEIARDDAREAIRTFVESGLADALEGQP